MIVSFSEIHSLGFKCTILWIRLQYFLFLEFHLIWEIKPVFGYKFLSTSLTLQIITEICSLFKTYTNLFKIFIIIIWYSFKMQFENEQQHKFSCAAHCALYIGGVCFTVNRYFIVIFLSLTHFHLQTHFFNCLFHDERILSD